MMESLAQFFVETNGGRDIPRELKPGIVRKFSRTMLGHGGHNIAEKTLTDGTHYIISQVHKGSSMWLECYRPDGTLAQQQSFNPTANAYRSTITDFNSGGNKIIHYQVFSANERPVEDISRDENGQLTGRRYTYPDLNGKQHSEQKKYGRDIRCQQLAVRHFRDSAGQMPEIDAHYDSEGYCTHEKHYDEHGQSVCALIEFYPKRRIHQKATTYTLSGVLESEQFYDKNGRSTRYIEYFTDYGANNESPKIKIDCRYENDEPREETFFRNDGTMRMRRMYEDDGKTRASEHFYNETGEFVVELHEFKAGKPSRKVQFGERGEVIDDTEGEILFRNDGTRHIRRVFEADGKTLANEYFYNTTGEFIIEQHEFNAGKLARKLQFEKVGDDIDTKRIILYRNGQAYRSREHRRWESTGDDFWAETDIDPKTGMPISSVLPTPAGLLRHEFDPKTGRLRMLDRHRQEFMGETLAEREIYYPAAKRTKHPECDTPLTLQRKEFFEEDGETLKASTDFRVDGSIKAQDERNEDGSWIHRVYAAGTHEITDDTPVLFESQRRPDGTLEHSTLRAHHDPAVIALSKTYDEKGNPTEVHIDSIDGNETLSWEAYARRRTQEREHTATANVTLATVNPDINTHDGGQTHSGRTVITLQGSEASLRRVMNRLTHNYPGVKATLCTGDNKIWQYKKHIGHYVVGGADLDGHPLLEKVNALVLTFPYQHSNHIKWPKHFSQSEINSKDAVSLRKQGIEEASLALATVCRHSSCDLNLALNPALSSLRGEAGQAQYFPYVVVSWQNKPYLHPLQSEVISEMLTGQIGMLNYQCSHIPGQNSLEVFAASSPFTQNVANRVASNAARELSEVLVPVHQRSKNHETQM